MEIGESEFRSLLDEVAAGSNDAARQLTEQYGRHVVRAVRRYLNTSLRSKVDSQDFVQAIWASFLMDQSALSRIETPRALIAFLSRVARNKVLNECSRRLGTQAYDIRRERSIQRSEGVSAVLYSRDPSPSQAAVANETRKRLFEGNPEHYQVIVALRLEGNTYTEIAQKTQVSVRTVQRVLDRVAQVVFQ